MTSLVTREPRPGEDGLILRCSRCGAALIVEAARECVAGDSERWFENEHRACEAPVRAKGRR